MKAFVWMVIGSLGMSATALAQGGCETEVAMLKARQVALAVESISVGARPLTAEVFSLSSQIDTYGVLLSYSGVQRTYLVVVRSKDCQIGKVELASPGL